MINPHRDLQGTRGVPTCLKATSPLVSNKANTCAATTGIRGEFNQLLATTFSIQNPLARANLLGATVRVAFHDAGEGDIRTVDTIGPDGCLSDSSDNNGLLEATSLVVSVLEPIWQNYCDQISRADFWSYVAKLALEASASSTISINYQYGRKDAASCSGGVGRLPSPQQTQSMYQAYYVAQLGLTLTDGVTLMGAHSLGHTHQENSGYGATVAAGNTDNLINAWDTTPHVFDNQYYINMINRGWPNAAQQNSINKNIWTRGDGTIMFNSDMGIGFDINLDDTNCVDCGIFTQRCGGANNALCTNPVGGAAVTNALATSYINNNQLFLNNFAQSFVKLTTFGYGVPANIDGATSTGKLGTLTAIDLSTCPAPTTTPTTVPTTVPTTLSTQATTAIPTLAPTSVRTSAPTTTAKTSPPTTAKTSPPTTAKTSPPTTAKTSPPTTAKTVPPTNLQPPPGGGGTKPPPPPPPARV